MQRRRIRQKNRWAYMLFFLGTGAVYLSCVDHWGVYEEPLRLVRNWCEEAGTGGFLAAGGSSVQGVDWIGGILDLMGGSAGGFRAEEVPDGAGSFWADGMSGGIPGGSWSDGMSGGIPGGSWSDGASGGGAGGSWADGASGGIPGGSWADGAPGGGAGGSWADGASGGIPGDSWADGASGGTGVYGAEGGSEAGGISGGVPGGSGADGVSGVFPGGSGADGVSGGTADGPGTADSGDGRADGIGSENLGEGGQAGGGDTDEFSGGGAGNSWRNGEPEYMTVEDDYFSDAVFIGDSRTVGMFEYGGLEDISTFYAFKGLTVYKMFDSEIVSVPGQKKKITVEEALQQNTFAKIYLMIGINEMGTGTVETFMEKYRESVEHLRELQPDAIIYLQGIIKVTAERSAQGDYITNEGIVERNDAIEQLADNERVFYLDVNPLICDETEGLISSYTFDGVHLKAQYIGIWKDYLKSHAIFP